MTNEQVAQRAYDVVLAVMTEGEATHQSGEWERQSIEDQVNHCGVHAEDADWDLCVEGNIERGKMNLSHAATRAVLALIVLEREAAG